MVIRDEMQRAKMLDENSVALVTKGDVLKRGTEWQKVRLPVACWRDVANLCWPGLEAGDPGRVSCYMLLWQARNSVCSHAQALDNIVQKVDETYRGLETTTPTMTYVINQLKNQQPHAIARRSKGGTARTHAHPVTRKGTKGAGLSSLAYPRLSLAYKRTASAAAAHLLVWAAQFQSWSQVVKRARQSAN